jgi:hypothetical protein
MMPVWRNVDIEEIIGRALYREFDLVHLQTGGSLTSRWHVTHIESGMIQSDGFAVSEIAARKKIDALLNERRKGTTDLH